MIVENAGDLLGRSDKTRYNERRDLPTTVGAGFLEAVPQKGIRQVFDLLGG
jgi:hypothetical protein